MKKAALPNPNWKSDWGYFRAYVLWMALPIWALVFIIDGKPGRRPWWAEFLLYFALGACVEILGALAYRMGRQHQLAIHAHLADEWIAQVEPGRAQARKDN